MQSTVLCKHVNKLCNSMSSSTSIETPPEIELILMNDEHRAKVDELVTDIFFRDEPLNQCLMFDLPHEPADFIQLVISTALEDRCSFVAIDTQTHEIIGVILNIIKHHRSSAATTMANPDKFDINRFQSEKLRFILSVLQHVHDHVDLFEKMNTDRLLHVLVLAIDPHYRGLRLTDKLIRTSLDQAKYELGIKAAFSEATSLYSAKAFRRLDFQMYDELVYADYDHIRLASLTGEHDRCQLLAKQL